MSAKSRRKVHLFVALTLGVFLGAIGIGLLILWFMASSQEAGAQAQFAALCGSDSAQCAVASTQAAIRSALAAEMTSQIAFVQLPLSVITIVFLGTTFLVSRRSLSVAEQANKNARQIAEESRRATELSLRAYLYPRLTHGCQFGRLSWPDGSIRLLCSLPLALRNSGKTPATDLSFECWMRTGPSPDAILSLEPDGLRLPQADTGASDEQVITLRQAVYDEWCPTLPPTFHLFIRVHCTYTDAFNGNRGFDYLWRLSDIASIIRASQAEGSRDNIMVETVSKHCSQW